MSELNLRAHHIIPYNIAPNLAKDLNNGILLCFKCHAASGTGLHSILGYEYSTSDWIEFASKRWLNLNFNNMFNSDDIIDLPNDLLDKND